MGGELAILSGDLVVAMPHHHGMTFATPFSASAQDSQLQLFQHALDPPAGHKLVARTRLEGRPALEVFAHLLLSYSRIFQYHM